MNDYRNIKHIFFDLDDTLWDFEKNSGKVLEELYHEFELSHKLNVSFHEFLDSYKTINSQLWKEYNIGNIDKQHLRNNRFHETFKLFDYNNYHENLLVTEQYLLRSPHGTELKNGCSETLYYLNNRYNLHIITNGFKEVQDLKIDNCKLRGYFKNIIISEEHKVNKPNEKIFRISEELAKCKTEECLMVGDNFDSDITGALNAGWKAIWINEQHSEGDHHSIPDLTDLMKFL